MNKAESKLVLELRAENAKFQKDMEEANRKLEKFGQTAERQTKQVANGFKEMDVASRKANHAIGVSSNKMNAFGVQMQDVIVQAQMGTSPFTILAQQGSQLAGVFGPTGALIGGVIALGAALGGILWRSMDAASAKAEEMRAELDKLYETTERAKMTALRDQIDAQESALKSLREQAKATSADMQRFGEAVQSPILRDTNMKGYMAALEQYADITEQIMRGEATLAKLKGKPEPGVPQSIEEQRKYYADLWKLEQEGQAFIDDLVKEALDGRAKMDKEAQDALLKQAREFNQQLAAIQSGQIRQEGPESQENALFAKNMEALQAAANSKLRLEFDVNALIQAERARHAAALSDISSKAIEEEMKLEGQRVDFIESMVKETLDARRKYEEDLQALLNEYDPLAREKSVHEARMAMLQNEHNQRLMTEANFNAAIEKERIRHERAMSQAKIEEMQASGEHIGALMAKYRFDAEHSAAFFSEVMANSIDGFVQNFSNGMAQAIVYGEDLRDAFDQAGKMLISSIISGMIQMGIQVLMNKAMSSAALAAATAEQIAAMAAISAAAAPAAAGVSLATVGANSGPAMAGIASTYSLSSSLALIGMAHDGIASVPREGTWLLDKGERVLSADHNERFVKAMEGESRGGVSVTNVFQVSAGVAGTVRAEIEKTLPAIQRMSVAAFESALRSGGSTSRAAGVR